MRWTARLGIFLACVPLYFGLLGPLGAAFVNLSSDWKHELNRPYRVISLPAKMVLGKCKPLQNVLWTYYCSWTEPFEEIEEMVLEADEPLTARSDR